MVILSTSIDTLSDPTFEVKEEQMFCDIKNINTLSDPTFEVKVEQMNSVIKY